MLAIAAAALLVPAAGAGAPALADSGATASKSVTVTIRDFSFHPPTVRVSKGDRVVWANLDDVKHTATRRGSFSTGKIKPGKAIAVTFRAKGTYRYHCAIHSDMTGKVVVG